MRARYSDARSPPALRHSAVRRSCTAFAELTVPVNEPISGHFSPPGPLPLSERLDHGRSCPAQSDNRTYPWPARRDQRLEQVTALVAGKNAAAYSAAKAAELHLARCRGRGSGTQTGATPGFYRGLQACYGKSPGNAGLFLCPFSRGNRHTLPVTPVLGGLLGTARRGRPAFRPRAVPASLRPHPDLSNRLQLMTTI